MGRTEALVTIDLANVGSPIGVLWLAFHCGDLCAAKFEGGRTDIRDAIKRRFGADVFLSRLTTDHDAVDGVRAYFAGDLDALQAVRIDAAGTAFQQRVWAQLRRIPPGKTVSYSELAARIRAPTAYRAVARANATNPISIVIPCHRVIGATGDLRGYGGGIERKAWLLSHEGAQRPE